MSATLTAPRQLKLKGMGLAAAKHEDSLKAAQLIAQFLGGLQPEVSINDVRRYVQGLQNASGSVFKGDEWVAVGWEEATHPEGHARCVRTWRLRGGR